jgi:hypothetical protein
VPDQSDFQKQHAILARLREKMDQTKALYEGAKKEHDRQLQRMKEQGMTNPDGSIHHAAEVYTFTLQLYRRALHEYNRFVLDGKTSGRGESGTKT